MLTSLFVLILMIAQTEKLCILSFWPSRFSPCRLQWRTRLWPHKKQWLQDQRAIESYLFPINIHRIGRNHRANDWVLKNIQLSWLGCLAGRPSFRLISLEIELLWIFRLSAGWWFPPSQIKQPARTAADILHRQLSSPLSSNQRRRRRPANGRWLFSR